MLDVIRKPPVQRLTLDADTTFPIAEAYRTARTNLMFALSAGKRKTVVFSSACAKDGKTATCANLALSMAQTGAHVLVIDADLRKPCAHRYFKQSNKRGFSNVLAGFCSFEEAVLRDAAPGLDLLCAGQIPQNPSELLGSELCTALLADLFDAYDYIFIDTPPINLVTDPVLLAKKADGIVLTVKQGVTTHDALQKTVGALEYACIPIFGVILTGVAPPNRYGRH